MTDPHKTLARRGERRFFLVAALAALVVVFAGFARTYYLKGAFGTPELPALVHVHGLVMSAWLLAFLAQVGLVAARRVDLHRRLGVAGVVLAALVVVVGVATAIEGARRGRTPGPPPLVFLAVPLVDITVFSILAGLGLVFRRRADVHKRLMLLSVVGTLTPAIARLPVEAIHAGGIPVFFALTDLGVLTCVAIDTVRNRRLHPAFGWGALLIVASQPLRLLLAGSAAWMRFATWIAG